MNDIASAKASFREQAVIFRRKHNWLMCWLYVGTFGSFIGYSAGLPLLVKTQFPGVDPIRYAFLGPLVGALAAPGRRLARRQARRRAGHLLELRRHGRRGGAACSRSCRTAARGGSFRGFLAMFLLLFATSGIGNGSTFRMIPVIFSTHHDGSPRARGAGARDAGEEGRRQGGRGGPRVQLGHRGLRRVLHPAGVRDLDEGAPAARRRRILGFIAVYLSCIAVTWWFYSRRNARMPC